MTAALETSEGDRGVRERTKQLFPAICILRKGGKKNRSTTQGPVAAVSLLRQSEGAHGPPRAWALRSSKPRTRRPRSAEPRSEKCEASANWILTRIASRYESKFSQEKLEGRCRNSIRYPAQFEPGKGGFQFHNDGWEALKSPLRNSRFFFSADRDNNLK